MNKKIQIIAKSLLDEKELNHKLSFDVDGIELHIPKDFIFGEEEGKLVDKYKTHIKNIHLPQKQNDKEMVDLKDLFLFNNKILSEYFQMAEYCYTGDDLITLIIHNSFSMTDILNTQFLIKRMTSVFNALFHAYPHVRIAIENISPFSYINGIMESRNGFGIENAELIKLLREKLPNHQDKLGTCLDICHAKSSQFILEELFCRYDWINNPIHILSLDDYFKANKDVIFTIHFNDAKNIGWDKNHGIDFDEYNFKQIMNLYNQYNYSCPLVIEQRENNYLDCQNLPKTINQIKGV